MDLFEKLRAAALAQSMGGEFPVWLTDGILEIAGSPGRHANKAHLVKMLIEQIGDFDPYAGAGCFGASVGAGTIQATIDRILIDDESPREVVS